MMRRADSNMIIIIKLHLIDAANNNKGHIIIGKYNDAQKASLGFDYHISENWHRYITSRIVPQKHIQLLLRASRIVGLRAVYEVFEFGRVAGEKSPYRNLYPQVYKDDGKIMLKEYGGLSDYARRIK
jgi:hypothetical protein